MKPEAEGLGPKFQRRSMLLFNVSIKIWFVVTAIGQWLFVAYISAYYWRRFLKDGIVGFEGTRMPNGYIPGDYLGNIMVVSHVLIAALIIAAGQIQLIPQIRSHTPWVHRWSGRIYLIGALMATIAGAYLILVRERVLGSPAQDVGVLLGAVLIVVFSVCAIHHAYNRDFVKHRRWALRLFMAVSAVWFLRQMVYGWYMLTGGIGINDTDFSGPFPTVANFIQYLLPLAVLELFFKAEKQPGTALQAKVAFVIIFMTILMIVGLFAVSRALWIPKILY